MAEDKRPYHERYRPAPLPDYMRYLTAPVQRYLDRGNMIASEGWAQANRGSEQVRGGDLPGGIFNMLLGPVNAVSAPITALLPTEGEIYESGAYGDAAPYVAAATTAAGFGLPGPKIKGMGRGMASLVDDVTTTEGRALERRLLDEAAQGGGMESSVTRDQALRNLAGLEPPRGVKVYHSSPHEFTKPQMGVASGTDKWEEGAGLYASSNPVVTDVYGGYFDRLAPESTVRAYLDEFDGDVAKTADVMRKWIADPNMHPQVRKNAQKTLDYLERRGAPAERAGKSNLYEWRLNAEPHEIMDLDRPLNRQPLHIKKVLEELGADVSASYPVMRWIKQLEHDKPAARALSEKLRARGIKAGKYTTREDADANLGSNYVIYDPADIAPLSRNGQPLAK